MNYQAEVSSDLMTMVKSDEGFRPRVYLDSEGLNTIGIGFCLDKTKMPEMVADFWCCYLLEKLHNRLFTNWFVGKTYRKLDHNRQCAIINMAYQMGITGVCRFEDMWSSLDTGDYEAAAEHALDSLWAHQTPKRARRVAGVLQDGSLKNYGI